MKYNPEQINSISLSLHASSNSFLNSFLREWTQWTHIKQGESDIKRRNGLGANVEGIYVELPTSLITLWLPLLHYSSFYLHRFSLPLGVRVGEGSWYETDISAIAYWVAREPQIGFELRQFVKQEAILSAYLFQSRVASSIVQTLKSIPYYTKSGNMHTFGSSEQALLYGHCAHPYPKFREGFTEDEEVQFLPEFQPSFSLIYLAVELELLWHTGNSAKEAIEYLTRLSIREENISHCCPPGFVLLPMHPWQWGKLVRHSFIQDAIAKKRIIILADGEMKWLPTTSVRTVYQADSEYMIKFSLSSRLTNSRRILAREEVKRGLWVYRAFTSNFGKDLIDRCRTLSMIHEPISFAIKNKDIPINESFLVLRENPFSRNTTAFSIATICQDAIDGKEILISRLIKQYSDYKKINAQKAALLWFRQYLEVAILPFIIALSEFGFMCSAHQQNVVLHTQNGFPVRVYFRDCQGTAFTTKAINVIKQEINNFPLNQSLRLSENDMHRLFSYYLLINNLFPLASSIRYAGFLTDDQLIQEIINFLNITKRSSCCDKLINYILTSKYLYSKGNFSLGIIDINESKIPQASFKSYVPLLNPLYLKN